MPSPPRSQLPRSHLLVRVVGGLLLGVVLLPAAPDRITASAATASPARTVPAPPSVRPVDGVVLRAFEPPPHAYGPGHRGVDLAAPGGAAVRATRDGRVHWAGSVAGRAWVTLDHGRGLRTTYGVVQPAVSTGQRVRAGDRIAHVDPGQAHLDWGAYVVRGRGRHYVDPLLLLADLRPVLVAPGAPGPGDPGHGV